MKFAWILILSAVCFAGEGSSLPNEPHTGNWLIQSCKSTREYNAGVCLGYIAAVADRASDYGACLRPNVSYGQVIKVIFKYADDSPQFLDFPGDVVIQFALKENFPCPTKTARKEQ